MKRGDAVKLSQKYLHGNGRYSWKIKASTRGIVTGFTRDGECVKVRWNGNSSSSSYHKTFITLAEKETVNNYSIY